MYESPASAVHPHLLLIPWLKSYLGPSQKPIPEYMLEPSPQVCIPNYHWDLGVLL